jgi:8-oxo-dGTP diphosphatase
MGSMNEAMAVNIRAPQVGVGVLVLRAGRLLLGRRRGAHGAGTWSAPGGHLEFAESPFECARRELREEAGLDAGTLQAGPFTSDVFAQEGRHYVTLFVLARAVSGEPLCLEPDKCEGWAWFEWSALPEPLFTPLGSLRRSGFDPQRWPAER